MWQYNQTPCPDELYHHGVPGMKWGQRKAEKRAVSQLKKAGYALGYAQNERAKGAQAAGEYKQRASKYQAKAKKHAEKGHTFRSNRAAKKAKNMEKRASAERAKAKAEAKIWVDKATARKEKASKIASKKNVTVGKSKADGILKEYTKVGRENAQTMDTVHKQMSEQREAAAREKKILELADSLDRMNKRRA